MKTTYFFKKSLFHDDKSYDIKQADNEWKLQVLAIFLHSWGKKILSDSDLSLHSHRKHYDTFYDSFGFD